MSRCLLAAFIFNALLLCLITRLHLRAADHAAKPQPFPSSHAGYVRPANPWAESEALAGKVREQRAGGQPARVGGAESAAGNLPRLRKATTQSRGPRARQQGGLGAGGTALKDAALVVFCFNR